MVSRLSQFSYETIDLLISEDVTMRYVKSLKRRGLWGEYDPATNRIAISPYVDNIHCENETILHEWLHGMEDLVLEKEYSEKTIMFWAHKHYTENPDLINYIKYFFPDFRKI